MSEPMKEGELHQLLDTLDEQQVHELKEETIRLVKEAFEGLTFEGLDEATNEYRIQYELLKQLTQGPTIGMVRAMAGDIDYQEFAKLMIFLGCTALAQKGIQDTVRKMAGEAPKAEKSKRFEVDLNKLKFS